VILNLGIFCASSFIDWIFHFSEGVEVFCYLLLAFGISILRFIFYLFLELFGLLFL
jgi:hypothetical protein